MMRPELCSIVLRQVGFPRPVASYHSCTITHMIQTILTAHGESRAFITNTNNLKLGGTDQGSAGSSILWYCHMEQLLEVLTKFPPGFQFTNVTNQTHFLRYIIRCIDDNSILCKLPNSTPTHELLQISKTVLQSWQRLLHYISGVLSLFKRIFTLITLVPTRYGELRMATIDETSGNLVIQKLPTTSECICRVEPNHTEHIIGARMVATAQMKIEYKYRLEQAIEIVSKIHRAPLLRIEAEAIYRHWVTISSYFLPVTTLTLKKVTKLMSPVYQSILPPLGYNRDTPHAILYGPLKYVGASRYHLYSAQRIKHVRRVIVHIRHDNDIALLYIVELNLLQL